MISNNNNKKENTDLVNSILDNVQSYEIFVFHLTYLVSQQRYIVDLAWRCMMSVFVEL